MRKKKRFVFRNNHQMSKSKLLNINLEIKKWRMQQKVKKENEKLEKVKENLLKKEMFQQKSMKRLRRKLLDESKINNSMVSQDSLGKLLN